MNNICLWPDEDVKWAQNEIKLPININIVPNWDLLDKIEHRFQELLNVNPKVHQRSTIIWAMLHFTRNSIFLH
jgi:hypothetical protein